MIVEMKHLTLLCVAREGVKALESLRDIGCVHLDLSSADSPDFASAKEELADAERAVRIVAKAAREAARDVGEPAPKGEEAARLENAKSAALVEEILKVDAERQAAEDEAEALRQMVRKYAPFGDFDPALAESLRKSGVPVRLAVDGGHPPQGKAFFGEELPEGWTEVTLPSERLSATQARLAAAEARAAACRAALAEANARVSTIEARYPALKDQVAFAAARDVLSTQGEVSWVTGWVPVDSVPRLRAKAVSRGWGILLREVRPDETPPTLIRPPKLFRPVAALFKGLGIAPGYTEADVSVPFMCYFSLFFAMLVGDGGYGAIILALTVWGWIKTRPVADKRHRPVLVRSWLTLLTVFSSATVIWGILSNTWFGAGLPFANDWATVKWLADPSYNNMMLLCFTIGASHLILARVWSGISMINDRVCLSQFGWAGIVFFMYWTTCSIVGIFSSFPSWLYWELGVSLALVFGFTLKGNELKSRGIELGMLPLNVMSCLGDIISYVRLFAVGLASVKVAQNFNDMAVGLDLPLWIKWLPLVLILLVGHGLNFAMAGLSILVHAVRLNTLEFSNHKGISWAGYAFAPFKKH